MSSSLLGFIIVLGGIFLYVGLLSFGVARAMAEEEKEILKLFNDATKNLDPTQKHAIMKTVVKELE